MEKRRYLEEEWVKGGKEISRKRSGWKEEKRYLEKGVD